MPSRVTDGGAPLGLVLFGADFSPASGALFTLGGDGLIWAVVGDTESDEMARKHITKADRRAAAERYANARFRGSADRNLSEESVFM